MKRKNTILIKKSVYLYGQMTHYSITRFFYKNTLYKNIDDKMNQNVKNVLRIRSSCIFSK